ncbi:hypothetical protein Esti_002762 [Eimeria stiedai]
MARNRDGTVPFMLAEDLHLWLISFTLLMVLTSSLAFVSSQMHSPPDDPLVELLILLNWAVVFGVAVLLWGLALLVDTRAAAWKLLFVTMCMVVIPRSCLPFRVGECMLQYICFIGFNFFTSHPTRKISILCAFAVLITIISDVAWGALPPFLVAARSIAGLTAIAAGHVGYQIIQAFSRQLREAKRLVLPLFFCSPTAVEGDGRKRANGSSAHHAKRGAHGLPHKYPLRRGLSHTAASAASGGFSDLQMAAGSRPLWLNKAAALGMCTDNGRMRASSSPLTRTPARRYWTALENYGPLYNQAVQRRLKLCKDDMRARAVIHMFTPLLVAAAAGATAAAAQNRATAAAAPAAKSNAAAAALGEERNGRTRGFKLGTPVMAVVPEAAEELVSSETPIACLRVDTPDVATRRFSRFHRSISVGQWPEKHEVWGSSEAAPATSESMSAEQRRSDVEGANSLLSSPADACQREDGSLNNREFVGEEKRERRTDGFRRSRALPPPLPKTTLGNHRLPLERTRRYFVRTRPSTWRANFSGRTAFLRTSAGGLGTRGLRLADDTGTCGCLPQLGFNDGSRNPKGGNAYAESGNRELVPMPKMVLGVFKDRAIERWYILWRADQIVEFYRETACFTLLICVLQCVFGMTRATIVEYLSEVGSFQVINVMCRLNFGVEGSVASLPVGTLFRSFGRHVAQLGILMALTLPMRFIESRGGRNVWKFQLLGLGQAVTHVFFIFVDVYLACFEFPYDRFDEDTQVARAAIQFVIGGYQIFPLLIIALSVQLRRVPEFAIVLASSGSTLMTVFILFSRGLELKVLLFFTLSRALYGAFALMIARSFESIRRQLFSTHVLPFLLYLSTLANSRQVDNIVALRETRGRASAH